jgi:hypothetical protein
MITLEEFVERLCRLGSDRGPRGFPRRSRDREILMKSIVLGLDADRVYSEPQINAKLQAWSREVAPAIAVDHVTLRRLLVDHGHLERTADGRAYRVGFPPRAVAFALAVYDLDPRAVAAAFREEQAQRARARPRPSVAGKRRR